MRQVVPQMDQRGHQPVDDHQLMAGAGSCGPLTGPASRSMATTLDPGLPWLGQLRDQTCKMVPGEPREQPMRQHRPIDHDRHTRIIPPASNDAPPVITHQLVNRPEAAGGRLRMHERHCMTHRTVPRGRCHRHRQLQRSAGGLVRLRRSSEASAADSGPFRRAAAQCCGSWGNWAWIDSRSRTSDQQALGERGGSTRTPLFPSASRSVGPVRAEYRAGEAGHEGVVGVLEFFVAEWPGEPASGVEDFLVPKWSPAGLPGRGPGRPVVLHPLSCAGRRYVPRRWSSVRAARFLGPGGGSPSRWAHPRRPGHQCGFPRCSRGRRL